jgi:hypothetical protein
MNALCRSFLALAVVSCLWPSVAFAQGATKTVVGTVVDSDGRPIRGAIVFMDEGPSSVTTGAVGAFGLEGITPGEHTLNVRMAGFTPRSFRLMFAADDPERRDVGGIMLEAGPDPRATLLGQVTGGLGGGPIANAVVELNGTRVALTDEDGIFLLPDIAIAWGPNQLEVHHLQFNDVVDEFWIANPDQTLEFYVGLDVEPIELSGIVVETPATLNEIRMRPFYERREKGIGHFITHDDIVERDARNFTNALRGIPGVRVEFGGRYGVQVFMTRSPGTRNQCPSPVIYLDGMLIVDNGEEIDLNALVDPEAVEGVELYSGVSMPIEFNRSGSTCGIIAIWTR